MFNNSLLIRLMRFPKPIYNTIRNESNALNLEKLEAETALNLELDEESRLKEEAIQKKRNKSKLQQAHRNLLLEQVPYSDGKHWVHATLKYNRKLYGKYGSASNFNPALCWYTPQEFEMKKEYERVAYPFMVPELIKMAKEKRIESEAKSQKRQDDIQQKMAKLETWKRELVAKIEKKENEAKAAKDRKDRLIEDVKRHFGYKIDPKDEKFKEMLVLKEKEEKKIMKDARKKAKEEKLLSKLIKPTGEKSIDTQQKE